jgi:hypothetical protein
MQYLDNDMDDLLRKAAENYPLKSGNHGWASVVMQLQTNEPVQKERAKKTKKKRRLFFLLLLIPLFSFSGYFLWKTSSHPVNVNEAAAHASSPNSIKKNSPYFINISKPHNTGLLTDSYILSNIPAVTTGPFQLPATESILPGKETIIHRQVYSRTGHLAATTPAAIPARVYAEGTNTTNNIWSDNLVAATNYPVKQSLSGSLLWPAPSLLNTYPLLLKTAGPEINKPLTNTQLKKGFYMGLQVGPDFSRVRQQSFHGTGFAAGLLLGYQFNNKFSIETGMLLGEKKYVCEGKYFSMKKISADMPVGMVLNSVSGDIRFIEIPVSVNYRFWQKRKASVSLQAGFSASLLIKEMNNYNGTSNGSTDKIQGIYNQPTMYLPATASVGVNYQHTIGKNTLLRLSPYVKLPVSKIGVGNIAVSSTGIGFGIIKQF